MLTAKQENFVQSIMDGMTQADAYRSAYDADRMADKTVHEKASRLMADGKIRARLKELRDKAMAPTIMSAQERLEWLTRLIESDEEVTPDKLKAIDIMNRMQGEYVTKVEGSLSVTKLEDLL